jgi:hypothetical protein
MPTGGVGYLLALDPETPFWVVVAVTTPAPIVPRIAPQLTIVANKHASGVAIMCVIRRGKPRRSPCAIATMIIIKAIAPKVPAKYHPAIGTKQEATVRIMQAIAAVIAVLRVFKLGDAGGKGEPVGNAGGKDEFMFTV